MEMAFNEHYHEVMEILADMLVSVFQGLRKHFAKEIAIVRDQYPIEEFKFPEKGSDVLCLTFKEGVALLHEAGHTEVAELEDLSTEMERTLGKIVREKYDTDFYILDKFPSAARPFYAMPDANDENYSNSYGRPHSSLLPVLLTMDRLLHARRGDSFWGPAYPRLRIPWQANEGVRCRPQLAGIRGLRAKFQERRAAACRWRYRFGARGVFVLGIG